MLLFYGSESFGTERNIYFYLFIYLSPSWGINFQLLEWGYGVEILHVDSPRLVESRYVFRLYPNWLFWEIWTGLVYPWNFPKEKP